ncbi:MAG: DUF262 domain-containing protein [Chloroflexota bacterium]
MKADSLHMGKVFSSGGDIHYVLPHFQREYAWEKPEWQTLIKDIFSVYELYHLYESGDEDNPPEHFMGALVVINDGMQAGTVPVFRLVDGQQRLTTISLFLCALARIVSEDETYQGLYKKIRKMLVNADEDGTLYYKLLPTLKYGDQESYRCVIDGQDPPQNVESKIPSAFHFLIKEISARYRANGIDLSRLFNVLMTSLQVVYINLDQRERPYEIFESLNYKGKSLTQADLVRNYIAMKLPPKRQEQAFMKLWSPIEEMLLEKRNVGRSRVGELTAFLRHYFAFLSGVLINQDHVYSRFRDRGEGMPPREFEDELYRLKKFAQFYNRLLRPSYEPDREIRQRLERLNILESGTAYPFLLLMYERLHSGTLERDAFLDGLQTIEVYMVRRFLNREPTSALNRIFPPLVREKQIQGAASQEFSRVLRTILGERKSPSDVRLRRSAETISLYRKDIYTRQKLNLIFQTVNRHLSAGSGAYTVLDDDPTIEHIMPQTLSKGWKEELGHNWIQEHDLLLHTLGNLTPVTQVWNSKLSNSIYSTKRAKLAEHGLRLNGDYFGPNAPDNWDGKAIRTRAQWLIKRITEIWPQLGETPIGYEEQPKMLTLLGESFTVNSWRDVLRQTADVVAAWAGDAFEEKVTVALPNYLKKEPHKGTSYQLANGWWIYVNLSAENVKRVCDILLEAADIPDEEFELVLW